MSQSQIEANRKDVSSGKRKSQKEQIHSLLFASQPLSVLSVVLKTGFKLPTVVGRLSELSTDGLVVEHQINEVTYYSYNYSVEHQNQLKKSKAQAKTKRVLNALIKDDEAFNIILKKVFLGSYELFDKGYDNEFIKEDIIAVIKKEIK